MDPERDRSAGLFLLVCMGLLGGVIFWIFLPAAQELGLEFAGPGKRYWSQSTGRLWLNLFAPRSKLQEMQMALGNLFGRTGRALAVAAAILAAVGVTTAPRPAHAISSGAAVGLGLGAFALGSVVGSAANPYYNPYYYGYYSPYYPYSYYYPTAPAYYPAAPYYAPRSCWSPYYQRYTAC